jgi:ribosomal silencing factor RsfS
MGSMKKQDLKNRLTSSRASSAFLRAAKELAFAVGCRAFDLSKKSKRRWVLIDRGALL